MPERGSAGPDRAKLAAWILLQLSRSDCEIFWDQEAEEVTIRKPQPLAEEEDPRFLEDELVWKLLPLDGAAEVLERVMKSPSEETIRDLFAVLIGPEHAKQVAQQLAGAPYEKIVKEAHKRTQGIYDVSYHHLVRQREGLAPSDAVGWGPQASPDGVAEAVFSEYARELAFVFPKVMKRAKRLSALPSCLLVPAKVQRYLVEVTKCYLYGRFLACLLICRSAVEVGLRDFLARKGKKPELRELQSQKKDGLGGLIALAQSLKRAKLNHTLEDALRVLRVTNPVVHPEVDTELPTADICEEIFITTRGILKELYT